MTAPPTMHAAALATYFPCSDMVNLPHNGDDVADNHPNVLLTNLYQHALCQQEAWLTVGDFLGKSTRRRTLIRSDKYWVSFSRQRKAQPFQKSNTSTPLIRGNDL
jgi:hypothetical protein